MALTQTHWFDPLKKPVEGLRDPAAADVASRLPRLLAKAREVAASLIHGVHGRRRAGAGETFWQYRPFAAGEAAQRIDWRRSARGDQLYVREREWEAAQNFFLWIDLSPSMAFKSSLAGDYKIDRAAVLGLALADALVRCGERVGALGGSPALCTRNIIERLSEILEAQRPESRVRNIPPSTSLPSRAKLALISDFLCDVEALEARLQDYADLGAHGALLMVLDPAEEAFPFAGETLFRDPDGGAPFHAGDAASLQRAYVERLAEHREALRAAAKKTGFMFLQHHTDRPAVEAALALLMGLEEASWG
ncbi:MAG TPA: DUF58 domain-containing protein [Methylocystis sp.]|nr:DUF58 domain-containing protein [Methylocystis sp.]